ncbi:MAG TPA: YciI family protein [Solirubrobacter sp.]|nr:YciI family protein [Solirubrobacter sp.]
MPQYAILMYEATPPDELPPEVLEAHGAVDAQMAAAGGRVLAGVALREAATATVVRDGLVTDGPFIETKEGLAGITVIEARDLDHALELARMVPIASGGVEVRPLLGFQVLD